MIIIADSGSTKTDWVVLGKDNQESFRIKTKGMNPLIITLEEMQEELNKTLELKKIIPEVQKVFFYGAGCSSAQMKALAREGLSSFFCNAEIVVDHDLLAAAYAVYRGKACMVGILGTGSNSAYFDGKTLKDESPSMAYILGDEGSGNHLGRKLIQNYFHGKLPEHLLKDFKEEFNDLSIAEFNINLYKKSYPNAYLASFSKFIYKHKSEPFIIKLIYDAMADFFEDQVLNYTESRFCEINFIGSIAFYYEDIIRAAAAEKRLKVGHIVQKPIDSLVEYHRKYILKN